MSDGPSTDPVIVDTSRRALLVPEQFIPFRRKTWSQAEGEREISIRLETLPSDLYFPEDFPEPIRYDPVRKLLLYRGFMSYGSFHYLRQLCCDCGYARALDILFTSSSHPSNSRRLSGWAIVIFVAVVIAVVVLIWMVALK